MTAKRIELQTMQQLRAALDVLWSGIGESCAVCRDPDCKGYVPVLPEEEAAILRHGPTVQANNSDDLIFIDGYMRDSEGRRIVGTSAPSCPFRAADGRCTIHQDRPLICYFYPLGPETTDDGKLVLALHTDCEHVRRLISGGVVGEKIAEIRGLWHALDASVRGRISEQWRAVEALHYRPNGPNEYIVVEELSA